MNYGGEFFKATKRLPTPPPGQGGPVELCTGLAGCPVHPDGLGLIGSIRTMDGQCVHCREPYPCQCPEPEDDYLTTAEGYAEDAVNTLDRAEADHVASDEMVAVVSALMAVYHVLLDIAYKLPARE